MGRTTITLNDDLLDELRREAAKDQSRTFKDLVNETLRLGLRVRRSAAKRPKFKVKAKDLGTFPGIDYNNIGELLDRIEGPDRKW
jgi:hypothetical protein